MDFAIGLVNSVPDLPKGQVKFFGESKIQKSCNQCSSDFLGEGAGGGGAGRMGVVEMTFWLVHAGYSLSSASYRLKFS